MGLLSVPHSFCIIPRRICLNRLFVTSFITGLLILAPMAVGERAGVLAAESRPAATVRDAQDAFEQRQYERVLALVEPLIKGRAPEARRLKIRSLVRLERPGDALAEYEQLEVQIRQLEPSLLREVAIGFITPVLRDMREQMRGAAYTALKEINSDEMIPYLEDGLSDGSGLVRALAAEGLGRLRAGQRSAQLRSAIVDQAAIVRVAVLKAMGRSGDRSVISLVEKSLHDEQLVVRIAASGALVMLGRSEAWNRLRETAGAPNPDERGAALRMLGELQDRRALPILQQALDDVQPSVRGAAAIALGDLGASEAAPALIRALRDPIPAVRASAAVSLGEVMARDSIPALKQSLGDANPAVRAAAISGLLRLNVPYEELAEVVRALTHSTDPGIRSSAARALSKSRGQDAKEAAMVLRLLLDDPLPRPRIAAARALGQVGDVEAIPILKHVLRDQDEAVRATGGGALVRLLDRHDNHKK